MRFGVWLFIVFFALSVAGGLIVFVVARILHMNVAIEDLSTLHARYVLTPWIAQGGRKPRNHRSRRRLAVSTTIADAAISTSRPDSSPSISATGIRRLPPRSPNRHSGSRTLAPSFGNDKRAELARAIVELAPWDEGGRVFFTTGGGEANEDAMKFARAITGRHKILSAYRSFHGSAPGAGTLTGENRRWPNEPGIPGVVRFFAPFPYRSPFHTRDPDEETDRAIEHLETSRLATKARENIAALLIEPIVGSNGVIVYPRVISCTGARALRSPWNSADIRRGDDGIRAHGSGLCRAALRRDARYRSRLPKA